MPLEPDPEDDAPFVPVELVCGTLLEDTTLELEAWELVRRDVVSREVDWREVDSPWRDVELVVSVSRDEDCAVDPRELDPVPDEALSELRPEVLDEVDEPTFELDVDDGFSPGRNVGGGKGNWSPVTVGRLQATPPGPTSMV